MADIFVIMPFGVKKISQGIDCNFDDVYQQLILPACAALGLSATRIDEVSFAGPIGGEIIKHLVSSEVVIADLTTANPNVYFELGIRQSLTERPTILIASIGTLLPFDIHDQRVEFYKYPAGPISQVEIGKLSNIIAHASTEGARSPILARLREIGLLANPQDRSAFEADLRQKIARAATLEQLVAVWYWAAEQSPLPAYLLVDLADRIAAHGDWELAVQIGERAVKEKPKDFELHRRYGWYLRNAGPTRYADAEAQFRAALELNAADPETLGMLGGLFKRMNRFEDAAECYDKGLRLSPGSLYMRVTQAEMTLLSDIVQKRESGKGIALYQGLYDDVLNDKNSRTDAWSLAVLGESCFVLGHQLEAIEFFQKASQLSANPTVLRSPAEQIELFGAHGFRAAEALQIVAILRPQPADVRTTEQSIQGVAVEAEAGPAPIIVHLSDIHFGSRLDKNGSPQIMHRFSMAIIPKRWRNIFVPS